MRATRQTPGSLKPGAKAYVSWGAKACCFWGARGFSLEALEVGSEAPGCEAVQGLRKGLREPGPGMAEAGAEVRDLCRAASWTRVLRLEVPQLSS